MRPAGAWFIVGSSSSELDDAELNAERDTSRGGDVCHTRVDSCLAHHACVRATCADNVRQRIESGFAFAVTVRCRGRGTRVVLLGDDVEGDVHVVIVVPERMRSSCASMSGVTPPSRAASVRLVSVVSQKSTINVEDTSLNIDAIEVKIDDDEEEKTRDVNFTIAMRARDIPRAPARGWGKLPNGSIPYARAKSRASAVKCAARRRRRRSNRSLSTSMFTLVHVPEHSAFHDIRKRDDVKWRIDGVFADNVHALLRFFVKPIIREASVDVHRRHARWMRANATTCVDIPHAL